MSRYLKQEAMFLRVARSDTGEPILDEYGEPVYAEALTVKCRKENYVVKAASGYGQFLDYKHTYYLDELVQPKVDDMLDGSKILNVAEYVDGTGTLVGYEVQV